MTERYTQEGLPVVSKNTLDLMCRDINQIGGEASKKIKETRVFDISSSPEFLMREHIRINNPQLYRHIQEMAKLEQTEQEKLSYLTGALTAYEAVRRQAEVNQLEEGLDGKI